MHTYRLHRICNSKFFLLAFLWIAGLLLGVYSISAANSGLDFSLYDLTSGHTSFISLFFVIAFPFAVCVFVLKSNRFYLIYPLLLILGFLRGFSGMFLFQLLGDGAWLVRLGYLYSASLSSVLIWWLLLKYLSSDNHLFVSNVYLAAALLFVFCFFDSVAIVPFMEDLLKYT